MSSHIPGRSGISLFPVMTFQCFNFVEIGYSKIQNLKKRTKTTTIYSIQTAVKDFIFLLGRKGFEGLKLCFSDSFDFWGKRNPKRSKFSQLPSVGFGCPACLALGRDCRSHRRQAQAALHP